MGKWPFPYNMPVVIILSLLRNKVSLGTFNITANGPTLYEGKLTGFSRG